MRAPPRTAARGGARIAARAWVRLPSGTRLDLLDPTPLDWSDEDLAIGLARTYRWGGHSVHALPLSVAQHSLLVLALRQRASRPTRRSSAPRHVGKRNAVRNDVAGKDVAGREGEAQAPRQALDEALAAPIARRELLHDADEGLLGFDPISPLKPFLGPGYAALADRLQRAIARRYALPDWTLAEKRAHKRADRVAAASEAVHVAGWTREEVRRTLRIIEPPEDVDPLAACFDVPPWVPWPADQAAERFLAALRRFSAPG